jgi:hypothetical protein
MEPTNIKKKATIFLPDFNQIWSFQTDILIKVPNIKFYGNPSSGGRAGTREGEGGRRPDGRTKMTKVKCPFSWLKFI